MWMISDSVPNQPQKGCSVNTWLEHSLHQAQCQSFATRLLCNCTNLFARSVVISVVYQETSTYRSPQCFHYCSIALCYVITSCYAVLRYMYRITFCINGNGYIQQQRFLLALGRSGNGSQQPRYTGRFTDLMRSKTYWERHCFQFESQIRESSSFVLCVKSCEMIINYSQVIWVFWLGLQIEHYSYLGRLLFKDIV